MEIVTGTATASAGTEDDHNPDVTVLYNAELVLDGDSYTLVVRDTLRGTLHKVTVPGKMVAKMPAYLSMLGARLVDE